MAENAVAKWHQRYQAAGLATLPLHQASKTPTEPAWQLVSPVEQWRSVGPDFKGNIGVRCGGGFAVVDCDNLQAADNVRALMAGLGLAWPEVQTATPGHRQFYLKLDKTPANGSWNLLPSDIGQGEFRYGPGAQVAAPCSWFNGRLYRFLTGSPEAWQGVRPVRWRDLQSLASPAAMMTLDNPPVRLVQREAPAAALHLLARCQRLRPGQPVDIRGQVAYGSVSEAEAAVVAMLILAGWDFSEIAAEFERSAPAHYAGKTPERRTKYLALTHRRVLSWLASTPQRQEIAALYQAAQTDAWPGRGGGLERAAYLAVLSVCWQCDSLTVNASERHLAEHAAASRRGVQNALKRLTVAGYLQRARGWRMTHNGGEGVQWRVECPKVARGHSGASRGFEAVPGVGDDGGAQNSPKLAELWAVSGLGRSSALVYTAITVISGQVWTFEGVTVAEIAAQTGKGINTIRRALRRLAAHGLAVGDGGRPERWQPGARTLEEVATDLQTEFAAQRRRDRHQREREAWQERIVRQRQADSEGASRHGTC